MPLSRRARAASPKGYVPTLRRFDVPDAASSPSLGVLETKQKSRKTYLREVNEQAEEMLFQLIKQMAKNEDVTESLKRQDQMAWVQRMNSIRDRAFEIVSKEIICN